LATAEPASITSARNRRIVEARKLDQRKHRERQGRFLVEGLQLIDMAERAGQRPLEVFYAVEILRTAAARALLERLRAAGGEMVPVSAEILDTLAARELSQGLLATFPLFTAELEGLRLSGRDLVLVLDRLQDPGNLGTLVRTADAAGARAVILIEPAVDPFHPKAVRATMGSLFHVPIVRTGDLAALASTLQAAGLRIVAADPYRGVLWGEGLLAGGVALVLGNEGRGLSEDVRQMAGAWVRLPMVGRAESLNVAEAGSILMYLWLRENLPPEGAPPGQPPDDRAAAPEQASPDGRPAP